LFYSSFNDFSSRTRHCFTP